MAKKLFPLLAILFLLVTTPSFAKNDKNESGNPEVKCSDNDDFKNHGSFVSCVAHLNQDGTSVSTAAHNSIGKHNQDEDEDDKDNDNDDDDSISSPTPTPSSSPSATPIASPSVSPTGSPPPTLSPSPASVTVNTEVKSALGEIIQSLQALITQLQNLIAG
jgi:hypothetical protein